MLTLYWIPFAPARKLYRIWLLFIRENGDFGAISAKERACAEPISRMESRILDRCSYYAGQRFVTARKANPE